MRTTLTLEDDVHAFAQIYAISRGITLSAALNELVRKAQEPAKAAPMEFPRSRSGFPMFPPSGGTITPELIKQLEEDEFEAETSA